MLYSRTLGPTHSTLTIEHILSTHAPPSVTTAGTPKSSANDANTTVSAATVVVTAVKVADATTTTPTKVVPSTSTPSTASISALNYVSLTLPASELQSLQVSLHIPTTFTTSLLRSFATESAVPLHSLVLLRPLGGKLFGFSLRVFARLEAHLAYTLGVSTTACPMDAHILDTQTQPQQASSSGGIPDNTPLKRVGSVAQVPTPNTPAVTAAVNTHIHDVDDLMTTTRDLCRLIVWIQTEYKHMAQQQLVLSLSGQQTSPMEPVESSTSSVRAMVDECVSAQSKRIADLRAALWKKICGVLANVCFILIKNHLIVIFMMHSLLLGYCFVIM